MPETASAEVFLRLPSTPVEPSCSVAPVAGNRYFLPETISRLAEIAQDLAETDPAGTFTAASFKDRSGVGRNLTIEILEYLDRVGFTRRVGDARVVLSKP